MTLENWMEGGPKIRCTTCKAVIEGLIRRLDKKPYCRECYYKKLNVKPLLQE